MSIVDVSRGSGSGFALYFKQKKTLKENTKPFKESKACID